jgi:D-alanyl-lipoteichoic acid acyltransferase DltB (MBOAT superfamily)
MLFNSIEFALFIAIVYPLYLRLGHKGQNRLLLVASYVFYGSWDWRFLSLIVISTVVDYFCGLKIEESRRSERRKRFLILSVVSNLSILGFFKYFNFFTENLQVLLARFGMHVQPHILNIVLPVGISFYTFQTMSYTIDVYRGELKPTRRFLDFALFVSFFPQLVAGPIERAKRLLPQILSPRTVRLEDFYAGCYLIFWGLFLKVFVADNLATLVDPVFAAGPPYDGARVLLALYAFAFQIFGDFAGYSNIARGLGRCMGFDIMVNFNLPYFAPNPREFWRRWHISLSTWLRDYLYIPLGGNRGGVRRMYRNLALTMLLGGLWHGAAWTFVLWGAYQGLLLIVHRAITPWLRRLPSPRSAPARTAGLVLRVILFFQLVCLGWLIFRAQSVTQVLEMLNAIFFRFDPGHVRGVLPMLLNILFIIGLLLPVQLFQYVRDDLLAMYRANPVLRAAFYAICFYLLLVFGVTGAKEFIYFQF